MKATIWESVEFGYSSKEGEMISDKLAGSGEDIEKAAQKLVEELTAGEPKLEAVGEAAKPVEA